MPTEVRGWTCDKCYRRYATRAQALECEATCTQPIRYVHPEELRAGPPLSVEALRKTFKRIKDEPLRPDLYQDSPAMRRALGIEEEEEL